MTKKKTYDKDKDTELLIWNFPKDLRLRFKKRVREEGQTMQATVVFLIEEYMKTPKDIAS